MTGKRGEWARQGVRRPVDRRWQATPVIRCVETAADGTVGHVLGVSHPSGSRFRVRAVHDSAGRTLGSWVLVRFR